MISLSKEKSACIPILSRKHHILANRKYNGGDPLEKSRTLKIVHLEIDVLSDSTNSLSESCLEFSALFILDLALQ